MSDVESRHGDCSGQGITISRPNKVNRALSIIMIWLSYLILSIYWIIALALLLRADRNNPSLITLEGSRVLVNYWSLSTTLY